VDADTIDTVRAIHAAVPEEPGAGP
jgi:hypothetical protein